MILYKNTR